MGSPDPRQIDGVGGAHPLTSKVAIISTLDADPDADVDYLFVQVVVDKPRSATVRTAATCSRASDRGRSSNGLVPVTRSHDSGAHPHGEHRQASPSRTCRRRGGTVRVRGRHAHRRRARNGGTDCARLSRRRGVELRLTAADRQRSSTRSTDIEVTCIDNGMPVVVLRASALGVTGDETPAQLEAKPRLVARVESIRLDVGPAHEPG